MPPVMRPNRHIAENETALRRVEIELAAATRRLEALGAA